MMSQVARTRGVEKLKATINPCKTRLLDDRRRDAVQRIKQGKALESL
jgi:hypothetical protein